MGFSIWRGACKMCAAIFTVVTRLEIGTLQLNRAPYAASKPFKEH